MSSRLFWPISLAIPVNGRNGVSRAQLTIGHQIEFNRIFRRCLKIVSLGFVCLLCQQHRIGVNVFFPFCVAATVLVIVNVRYPYECKDVALIDTLPLADDIRSNFTERLLDCLNKLLFVRSFLNI